MNKTERCDFIFQTLNQLYPAPPIPLNHQDGYTLLIAVLLSAQCTDERVNKVTPKLFSLAPNPESMAKLGRETIQEIIRPCGLSERKAKAIDQLSHILLDKFQGKIPNSLEELESLPGVGHKTASVVMAQHFGVPAFPVDTHIHRLAQRWRLTSGKNVETTEKDLKEFFPRESWNKLHLQIIFYGREYCKAHECFGLNCPICSVVNQGRITPIATLK